MPDTASQDSIYTRSSSPLVLLDVEPIVRYPGSKWEQMQHIMAFLSPAFHNHWVDVFGGSGAGILGKPPSRMETFNDPRSTRLQPLQRPARRPPASEARQVSHVYAFP